MWMAMVTETWCQLGWKCCPDLVKGKGKISSEINCYHWAWEAKVRRVRWYFGCTWRCRRKQACEQKDKQMDREADEQTDRRADRQTDRQTDNQAYCVDEGDYPGHWGLNIAFPHWERFKLNFSLSIHRLFAAFWWRFSLFFSRSVTENTFGYAYVMLKRPNQLYI